MMGEFNANLLFEALGPMDHGESWVAVIILLLLSVSKNST
jgi:hypothetical protein